MPIGILEQQQRLRQLGEIRIGHTVSVKGTDKNGKAKRRPAKLDKFRFTSPSKGLLEKVAALYGGTPQPWSPQNGGAAEWELYSTVDQLPVLVPPSATSQWFELYVGPRCVRRCDGVTEMRGDRKCLCDPRGQLGWTDERECKVTTRLNVVLRDVPAIGMWLIVSRGRNAAVELPPMAEFLAMTQGYVSARLGMEARETFPLDGPSFKYMVPTLEADQAPGALISGAGVAALSGAPKAVGPGPKAIEAKMAQPDPGPEYWMAQADSAETLDALAAVVSSAKGARRVWDEKDPLFLHFMARRRELQDAEVVVAEIVEDPAEPPQDVDLDEVWGRILEHTPDGWSSDRVADEFAKRSQGVTPGSADAAQMVSFLAWLKDGAR